MIRRELVILNGLLLSAVVATVAFGQTSTQRKTLSQRMADMRHGWSQSEDSQPAEQFPTPEAEGGSIIPNWLSSGDQKKANAANAQRQNQAATQKKAVRPQSGSTAQTGTARSTNSRAVASPPVSGKTKSADGNSLPGLGGSRLPNGGTAKVQPRAGSGSNRYSAAAPSDADYPVIRGKAPTSSSTASAANPNDSSRHSPSTRKSPGASAQALRRELAETRSKTNANNGPVARTAQANERYGTSGDVAIDASAEPSSEEQHTAGANSALSAPAIVPPVDAVGESANDDEAAGSPSTSAAAEAFGSPSSRSSIGASEFIRSPRTNALPDMPSAARSREAFGEALQVASGGDPSVLASNQTPVITSDIRGPKQILVGREAVYRIRLQNQSAAGAQGVVASIRIPASAEIVDSTATQGTVQPAQNSSATNLLEWQLSSLEPRASEVLDIRLIPRESKPLELGVSWTIAPVGSRTIVEVQEPQLKIEIGGPTEVMFDKPQVFRLTLSNPGTGPADNVRIDLVPPGAAQDAATSHTVGNLAPGESKSVEIELTAREAGKLTMKAIAIAEGGLTADVTHDIFCRKPELQVDWRGPASKYAGTPATYFFRVRNPGTAPAESVTVTVSLPQGAEFNSASEGQEFNSERREVAWNVGTLNPGDDTYMELKCVVKTPGSNQFKITATNGTGELSDSKIAETNVEAIADLKLSVSDPNGPVAVGTQAAYEIHVENRGADTARNVNIVALFSEGIEPEQADGVYTVADGRVSFRAVDEIAAGDHVTLRIRARALKPGTHVFRAEVLCSDLEIKLAAEETTRFYADDVMPESEDPADQSASRNGFESSVR